MLRPVFFALTVVIVFSPTFADISSCSSPGEVCDLKDARTRRKSTLTSASTSVPSNRNDRVTCRTPDGDVPNQEFCYYAIEVGDSNYNMMVYYPLINTDNEMRELLVKQIRPFCELDDTNFEDTKLFPSFTTTIREEQYNDKSINATILIDLWDMCYWASGPHYFKRYCCCPNNMQKCVPPTIVNSDIVMCSLGRFTSVQPKYRTIDDRTDLAAKMCFIKYNWTPDNPNNTAVEVTMGPWTFDVLSLFNIDKFRCAVTPNRNTACPHLDSKKEKQEVICVCNFRDFCNLEYYLGSKSKDVMMSKFISKGLEKNTKHCNYTSQQFFHSDAFMKDGKMFCPVFYDIAKRAPMNLDHSANMRFRKANVNSILTSGDCNVEEVILNREVFTFVCKQPDKGYQSFDFHLPRLVMVCSCTDGNRKQNDHCDVALRASLKDKFAAQFESTLPRCFERRTEFNVAIFNIADHMKNRSTIVNSETRYCYQAYSPNRVPRKRKTTGFLESGSITSRNEKYAKMCAKLIKDEKNCVVTEDKGVFCCCRVEEGTSEPCNDLLVSRTLVASLLTEDRMHEEDCSGETSSGPPHLSTPFALCSTARLVALISAQRVVRTSIPHVHSAARSLSIAMVRQSSSAESRTIWVVRHGERVDNVDKEWRLTAPRGAWDDPPLTPRGLRQAQECGIRLADERIDHVITSPFLRCLQTTTEILKQRWKPMKMHVEPGFGEQMDVCQFPAGYLPLHAAQEQFPLIDAGYKPIVKQAQSPEDDCTPRVRKTLDGLLSRFNGNLLIVSHGSPIGATHTVLTGRYFYPGQCTISAFQKDDPSLALFDRVLAGDSSHLSDPTNLRDRKD
ncbi:hypothetical protein QR680_008029 [Steinernema hermaphroditum]|uniref:Uncharacterized protein n=1 Tax=Steinernema hermaphroditum TaxID=289476 RepID=A0AA39M740_9BILA|nr:hypothetical protein QR680_008029 [Steinernema hermaphroditum]